MSDDAALVLAAGKGTRMRSSLPKVLHRLAGKPMLVRVLDALCQAGFSRPWVVIGYGREEIEKVIGDRCTYVLQDEQGGTGHAAQVGLDALPPSIRRVLVVHGDEPLIPGSVFGEMLDLQKRSGALMLLLTARVDDTRGFGRVIRNDRGEPVALVQESELSAEQQTVREVHLGAYVFDAGFLGRCLPRLEAHPPKGELYLTDLVAMAREERAQGAVAALTIQGGAEVMGVNDLVQLEEAGQAIYRQTNRRLMADGVTIVDSASTFIDEEVQIQPDTVIYPFTIISGTTSIGGSCAIGPHAHIRTSRIGERCRVQASTVEESIVGDGVSVGPYAHLGPRTTVEADAEIGTHAQIKRSTVGPRTKMHHFSYLGDASVGADVNIGAGAVTGNYDGAAKHRTVIEDGAFIGSDTILRAPVTVGEEAVTGAGSVVLQDVPPRSVVAGVPARVIREGDAGVHEFQAGLRTRSEV